MRLLTMTAIFRSMIRFIPCVLPGIGAWCDHSIAASAGNAVAAVTRSQLCVTEGAIEQSAAERRWSITVSKLRAYVNFRTEPVVEMGLGWIGRARGTRLRWARRYTFRQCPS
jgi:hypothetical protein